MPMLFGIRPGGRDGFALVALYTATGRLPGHLVASESLTGVRAVLDRILGIVGEWGELNAVAIDAPLTWAGTDTGLRRADTVLKAEAPAWVPKTWFRPPNAVPGAIAIQGPALTWAMAVEAKRGSLPAHEVYECHPRASLARTLRDLQDAVLGYRDTKLGVADRRAHVRQLAERFFSAGLVASETDPPETAAELDAMVCAITAHGVAFPDTGYVTHCIAGGEIRPVGRRPIAMLDALP